MINKCKAIEYAKLSRLKIPIMAFPKEDFSKISFESEVGAQLANNVQNKAVKMIEMLNDQSKKIKKARNNGIQYLICIHYLIVSLLSRRYTVMYSNISEKFG